MAVKLLCLSSANTSPFAKAFLQYIAKHDSIEYDYAEIEPYVLAKIPFTKLLTHFCSQTPDYVMSLMDIIAILKMTQKSLLLK